MHRMLIAILGLLPCTALADEDRLALSAPQALADSGVLQYLLPRFALKHGVRIRLTDDAPEATLGTVGTAVFTGLGTEWRLSHDDSAEAVAFQNWILSEIGRRTLASFEGAAFSPPAEERTVAAPARIEGDPVIGERLALRHCGRCHVINESNRMSGIGATPSFSVLRALPEWQNRFATFYVLNPHPSFTQVAGITPPFAAHRPPGIFPVHVTPDEVDAIAAYAATLPPADLGAPIRSD